MIKLNCKNCKREFKVFPYRLKRDDSRVGFCSSHCYHQAKKGETLTIETRDKMSNTHKAIKHPWLKGLVPWNKDKGKGWFADGYFFPKGKSAEHRVVVENGLGRKLKKNEVVHHINGIRNDNRLENLQYFRHVTAHQRIHQFSRRHGMSLDNFRTDWENLYV